MPRCKICSKDVIATLDNICLICHPPNEKEIEVISSLMVLVADHIRDSRQQKLLDKGK